MKSKFMIPILIYWQFHSPANVLEPIPLIHYQCKTATKGIGIYREKVMTIKINKENLVRWSKSKVKVKEP